ncbi:MAG: hypothetical protein ACE5F5_08480 [Acidimicrobiia bacterium]
MKSEGGSLTPLIAAVVALVALAAVATASLAVVYTARVKAVTAADASALAAAAGTYPATGVGLPAVAARRAAEANGAELVSCRCSLDSSLHPREVTVVAAVSADLPVLGRLRIRAASRAEFEPLVWLSR